MKTLMQKLSQYWQLRYLVIGGCTLLVIYAVVMPVHGVEKSGSPEAMSIAKAGDRSDPGVSEGNTQRGAMASKSWIGENFAAAQQLQLVANSYEDEQMPLDYSDAVRALRTGAAKGDPVCQLLMGHAYQVGMGVAKDMSETARWYAMAAAARKADATGSTPADLEAALAAYRQRAESGDAAAQVYFGLAYDSGTDVPKNSLQAANWYRKAAAQGGASAANNLGVLYYNGQGVPKDSVAAVNWLQRAANGGSASAQYNLGRMYFLGEGVAKNDAQAAAWFEKAARQGSSHAEVMLSLMAATGDGINGDTAKAYMWINLASANEEQARVARETIEKEVSVADVAEGQKLTHDWLAHGAAR